MPDAKLVVTLYGMGPWQLAAGCLAAVVVAAVIVEWRTDRRGKHDQPWPDGAVAWWLWHWYTGGPLEARVAFHDHDVDRARYIAHRALVGTGRTAVAAALVLVEYVRSGAPYGLGPVALAGVGLGGAVAAALVVVLVFFVADQVAHYQQWIRPLHLALYELAGWPEDKRPRTWLTVPRRRAEGRNGVIVKVPPTFDVRDKHVEKVAEVVRTRLDLGDVKMAPVLHRRHGYLKFQPRERLPDRVAFSDPGVRAMLEAALPSAPVIGVNRRGAAVTIDLDTESPHVLLSAGTGAGKSTTFTTMVAQLMRDGAKVTVLDVKRHSHQWIRPLPGITYARDLGEIHRVLVELGQEGHRRNVAWDDVDIDEPGPVFTRHIVICEEMNATMSVLRGWWKNHRDRGDPTTSPAITSLAQILFMGRQVRMHVFAIAQMATAKDTGGPEMRENFGCRILARYTDRAAKMLVPECKLPPSTPHRGRVQVCIGGTATETQVIYMTPREARSFVAEERGLAPKAVAGVAGRSIPISLGEQAATVAGRPALAAVDGVPLLTLRELSSDRGLGVVMLRHDALRQAALRDPEFPSPVSQRGTARLYHPHHVQQWEPNRPSGGRQAPDDSRNEGDEVDRMEPREHG
jgi:hypothetical protein